MKAAICSVAFDSTGFIEIDSFLPCCWGMVVKKFRGTTSARLEFVSHYNKQSCGSNEKISGGASNFQKVKQEGNKTEKLCLFDLVDLQICFQQCGTHFWKLLEKFWDVCANFKNFEIAEIRLFFKMVSPLFLLF